jgi:hypothetical protein
MDIDGMINKYELEKKEQAPLSGLEESIFHLQAKETWDLFQIFTTGQRRIREDIVSVVYESVDMGEHEVNGERKRIYAQPREERVGSQWGNPVFTQIELELVIPDEVIEVTQTEEVFHGGNSTSLGFLKFHFGGRRTAENYKELCDIRELLQEVNDAKTYNNSGV